MMKKEKEKVEAVAGEEKKERRREKEVRSSRECSWNGRRGKLSELKGGGWKYPSSLIVICLLRSAVRYTSLPGTNREGLGPLALAMAIRISSSSSPSKGSSDRIVRPNTYGIASVRYVCCVLSVECVECVDMRIGVCWSVRGVHLCMDKVRIEWSTALSIYVCIVE